MNSMQVKDKLKNIARKRNLDFNTLLRLYMYDRFIERLAESEYKDNFILKGGFYLSTLFGLENRSTKDIDTAIRDTNFTLENIEEIIKSIISIDINDGAIIDFVEVCNIREEDEYGGFRVILKVKVDTIKEVFQIDVVTGDPITPCPDEYKYFPILGDNYIKIWSYNIETIIAEKLETILRRAEANGRTRDYYDLYLIYTKGWDKVNINNLCKSIEKTFNKRKYSGDIKETISVLNESEIMRKRWDFYRKKYDYARNIKYEEIMMCIENIVGMIEKSYSINKTT
ncbi:MAG: nucleotidyl transferase AbiEii/AbiGii toxin family protein [Bacilli bacterium]|nr:nucleotidyl transferase AbiEii/AbiGii toxin family protein [Bacilli bacterium]